MAVRVWCLGASQDVSDITAFSIVEGCGSTTFAFWSRCGPICPTAHASTRRQPFMEQTGLAYVSGCEVQGMLDDKDRVIEEGLDQDVQSVAGP
ncbi:RNA helicase aquarius [Salmo salar]|uniref:RNA helicase aquarius n=1 Tax=Salmo salar TaxID=8030 RepID=A0A1S3SQ51_SALSA|nr:RNA helicase aquarius-like [Salmo salar]|eukprot:XP_014066455.1 PREDICTED: intron-binding protein aquarius-like [Salmo salar]